MRMKSSRWAPLAAIALLMAPGCYQSDFPLDSTPRVDVDAAWLGTWRCLPFNADADEDPVTIAVGRGADRRYDITWRETGKEPEQYEAYESSVRGHRFMNVRERKAAGEMGQWVFLGATLLRPDVLQLQVVDAKALESVEKSPTSVRRALERQLSRPTTLFADFCVCVRAKAPSEPAPGR
jgi:hypothetical protein